MKKLIITSLLIGTIVSLPLFWLHFRYIGAFMGCEKPIEVVEGSCAEQRALGPYVIFPLTFYLFLLLGSPGQALSFLPSALHIAVIFLLFSVPFWMLVFLIGMRLKKSNIKWVKIRRLLNSRIVLIDDQKENN